MRSRLFTLSAFLVSITLLALLGLSGVWPMAVQAQGGAFTCDGVTEIPQAECEALVALYNSTNGSAWTDNTGWLATNTPCSWYNIICAGGHVTGLVLQNNQLSGSIPPELGNLTEMNYLGLSNNLLSGSIPPELGDLAKLNVLHLEYNQLSGSIPPELGNLGVLTHLQLEYNQLSGAIPPELGNLASLNVLGLSSSPQLSGPLPGNLTNLTKLFAFWFDGTSLCEPADAAFQAWLAGIGNLKSTGVICNTIPDTDGDGLPDEWEINGYDHEGDGTIDVDLPAMGADPEKPDIFVEIDYMVDPSHSHRPKPGAIEKVVEAFATAPVLNPDNSTGINLHVDYGPNSVMNPETGEKWGNRSEANELPHDDSLGSLCGEYCYNWNEFDAIKKTFFSAARAPVFHYAVFAHNLGGFGSTSGISRGIGASDFIASLGSWSGGVGTVNQQAGTFMHELGHNLGLRHGGDDHTNNYEPDFLSIMNYSFQTRGLIINGQEGYFDYSRFTLPNLNENNLDETVGLNGGSAINGYGTRYYCASGGDRVVNNANGQIDWNCNGDNTDTNVQTDINKDSNLSVLGSYNDWANLVFTGGAIGQLGVIPDLPGETEVEEITQEEDAALTTVYGVAVTVPGNIAVLPGNTLVYTFTVANLGINADTYTVTVNSSLGWTDLSSAPTSLSLSAGTNTKIPITVNVPPSAGGEAVDELVFSAVSQANPLVEDSAVAVTSVIHRVYLPMVLKDG